MNDPLTFTVGTRVQRAELLDRMIASARERNDALARDAIETAAIRGEIGVLKKLRSWLSEPDTTGVASMGPDHAYTA